MVSRLLRIIALCCVLSLLFATVASAELATLYGDGSDGYAGRLTATGDVCCPGYTMAHPNPALLGTYADVCHGDLCVYGVLINDVGSIPDMSPAAASALDMYGCGICEVEITYH